MPKIATAATTTPGTIAYQGRLLNASSTPLSGTYTFRFSVWSDADWDAGDFTGGGAIDVGSAGYAGWQETQTVTTNAFGLFDVAIGSITPLPNFTASTHKFLEVDVKLSTDPDTSFEVLDPSGTTADLTDRSALNKKAYAENADTIDNADVGTTTGDIAVLGAGGVWDIARIPAGTNADSWTIDANDDATDPYLQFSVTGTNRLTFVNASDWFDFNNDVNIAGNITITGTVDGVDLSALAFSDLATRVNEITFSAEYPNFTVEPDGTANRGKLETDFIDLGGTAKRNFYDWTTKQASLNDSDVVVSFRLPNDFVSFTASPLEVTYQTSDGVTITNKVDVEFFDTTGTSVALTGGSALANASWTTANITFGGSPTFTAGNVVTLKLKLSATSAGFARVADIVFNYNGR